MTDTHMQHIHASYAKALGSDVVMSFHKLNKEGNPCVEVKFTIDPGQFLVVDASEHAPTVDVIVELTRIFPTLIDKVDCPADGCSMSSTLRSIIMHLNDHTHEWTREAIADWLETLDIDLALRNE